MTLEHGRWLVTVHVDSSGGEVRCVGLDVHGFDGRTGDLNDPPKPLTGVQLTEITSTSMRKLHVPALVRAACEKLAVQPVEGLTGHQLKELRTAFDQKGRRYNLAHFEEVAVVYSNAVAAGDKPTKAVAERFHLSGPAAKKHVARCREFGILRPTRPGKAGGAVRQARTDDEFRLAESESVRRVDRDWTS